MAIPRRPAPTAAQAGGAQAGRGEPARGASGCPPWPARSDRITVLSWRDINCIGFDYSLSLFAIQFKLRSFQLFISIVNEITAPNEIGRQLQRVAGMQGRDPAHGAGPRRPNTGQRVGLRRTEKEGARHVVGRPGSGKTRAMRNRPPAVDDAPPAVSALAIQPPEPAVGYPSRRLRREHVHGAPGCATERVPHRSAAGAIPDARGHCLLRDSWRRHQRKAWQSAAKANASIMHHDNSVT